MPGVGEGLVDEDRDLAASLAPPAPHTSPTSPSQGSTAAKSQSYHTFCVVFLWMSGVSVWLMQMLLALVSLMKKAPWIELASA